MDHTYWLRQKDTPLFPDLLWARPENKLHAGKLLIIGGNAHGFSAPAEAFVMADKAGIGITRVILPDHIRPQITKFLDPNMTMEFTPSTPSGSFAANSLAELIDASLWADGVLIAGDLGRNSETAILLEKFVSKINKPILITKDACDYFTATPNLINDKDNICLTLSIAQLQKLFIISKSPNAIKFSMETMQLVEAIHEFTIKNKIKIITKHLDMIYVALDGKVSTTQNDANFDDSWRVPIGTKAIVWWLQNQNKPFEALTTSVLQ